MKRVGGCCWRRVYQEGIEMAKPANELGNRNKLLWLESRGVMAGMQRLED